MTLDELVKLKKKYRYDDRPSDVRQLLNEVDHLRSTLYSVRDLLDKAVVADMIEMLRLASRFSIDLITRDIGGEGDDDA